MIDAYITRPSYVAHVAAVWQALPAEERGTVYAGTGVNELARYAPTLPWVHGRPPAAGGPVLVASGSDSQAVEGRPVVLLEHGAGQAYAGVEASGYSGGPGRDRISLFLTPNETTAARNRDRYPNAEHVICGAPAVDPQLAEVAAGASTRPVIACTFHWRCDLVPETRPAWEHYSDAVANHVAAHDEVIWLGHSHPRQAYEFMPWWQSLGVVTEHDPRYVLGMCSVLIADNTSLLYEAARIGRPVIVLDAPWYRREVEHGLRFWSHADLGIRIGDPADLAPAISAALDDLPEVAERRAELAADVFPLIGPDAARAAADAIVALK